MPTDALPTPPADDPAAAAAGAAAAEDERTTQHRLRAVAARAKSIWCGILSGLG